MDTEQSSKLKFLFLRLPSLIVADLILLNSDYILDHIKIKSDFLNFVTVYVVSRFVLLTLLFICFLAFTLSSLYVQRIYKIVFLVSLPFLFTFLIKYIEQNPILFFEFQVPKFIPILLVYLIISSLTIELYVEIYSNFILDKINLYKYYQLYASRGEEVHFFHILFGHPYENLEEHVRIDHIGRDKIDELSVFLQDLESSNNIVASQKKRRIFILAYSVLSLIINETPFFVDTSQERLNIISLGYLLLLGYDLGINLDQMLFRFLLEIKLLGRNISQFGLNNFISFNWFERLRIPFILRVYFLIKVAIFTINFLLYLNYYIDLENKISNQANNETKSLFSSIYSLVLRLFKYSESIDIENNLQPIENNQNYFIFDSIWNQCLSLIPFVQFKKLQFLNEIEYLNDWKNLNLSDICFVYIKILVLILSNTLISIACTTSALSYQFHLLGLFVNSLINCPLEANRNARIINNQQGAEAPEASIQNVGDVAAILFFLLSLQSGLSSLNGQQRIERFFRNYSLLFIAILHYFHTSLDAQLMTLSASSKLTLNNKRHIRILAVCASLIVIPTLIIIIMWSHFEVSTWLLAATSFNVELIVKMFVSFLLYILFLVESKHVIFALEKITNKKKDDDSNEESDESSSLSDKLDDYIYYVKAFGHVFEFIVALFLFFNGAYILFFESYGAIRAIMMCIHAYFHIWCQARKGWSVFIKRRTAIAKLKNLAKFNKNSFLNVIFKNRPELSESEKNSEYEDKCRDVCPICFGELRAHEALITNCNHIFHFICLRKWLYLQDTCPMCHQLVYQSTVSTTEN